MLKTILIVVNWWATNLLRAWWCFAQLPKRRRNKLSASAGWEAATAMNFSARPLFYSRTGERQTGFPELDCFVASEKSRQQRFFASSCNFFVTTHPLPRPTPPPFCRKCAPAKSTHPCPFECRVQKPPPSIPASIGSETYQHWNFSLLLLQIFWKNISIIVKLSIFKYQVSTMYSKMSSNSSSNSSAFCAQR